MYCEARYPPPSYGVSAVAALVTVDERCFENWVIAEQRLC